MQAQTITNRRQSRQKGFTLIEIIVVLFIIAAILFFATRAATNANSRTTQNALTQQIIVLADTVTGVYKFNNFTGLSAQNLCESRQISDVCSGTGAATQIRHDFQGTVAVAPANCGGGTANCFTMAAANIPGNACASVVSGVQGKASAITVGSTVVKNASTAYSQAAANTACNADSMTITFTFG